MDIVIHKSQVFLLVHYLKPQWPRAAGMAFMLLIGIALQAWGPQMLKIFIDQVSLRVGQKDLALTALAYLGVVTAGQAISAVGVYSSAIVAWEATNRLRSDLAQHCLQLDMHFHHAHTPGEMIQRIDGDVSLLGNFFSQFVVQIAANGVLVLAILAIILMDNVTAGLVLVIYMIFAFGLLRRVQKAGGDSFSKSREIQMKAVGFWEEMLTMREDIKPLGALGYILHRNRELDQEMMPLGRKALVLFHAYTVAFAAVFVVGNAIAFAVGAHLYGQKLVSIGGVFLLLSYTSLLANKVGNIVNHSNDFQQAVIAIRRVTELMDTISPLQDGPGLPSFPKPPAVEFEHVSFAYTPETQVLHDLSFHLEGGKRLGLLGRTGSGKSTIVRLLFRFYDPSSGAVRLDGVNLCQARLSQLRARIGMVTQEVQLLHATVRDNLTLFNDLIQDEQAVAVLGEVGLAAWLNSMPQGLDTLLSGDAGMSAGEAQLLGLARVFLQNPQIVILDEASARLDPATEARLEQAVDRLLEGRTAFIIAHRLNTLRRVDQVLVLDEGRLMEYGARKQLEADPESEFSRLQRMALANPGNTV